MSAPSTQPPTPRVPMYRVGLIVLVGLFGYFGFLAIDSVGLESRVAAARVVSTGYRAAGETYVTQIVNNRPLVLPQTVPEAFLAELDVEGAVVTAGVDKDVHDRLRAGDEVRATVTRTRLTGRLSVVEVQPEGTGPGPRIREPR